MAGRDTKTRFQGVRSPPAPLRGRAGRRVQLQAELLRRGVRLRSEARGQDEDHGHRRGGPQRSCRSGRHARAGRGIRTRWDRAGRGSPAVRDSRGEGRVLNKHGRRYKPRAIANIDECPRVHVEPSLGEMPLADIRRGEVQAIVDDLTPRRSGSRVRAIVNSLCSLAAGAGARPGRERPGRAGQAAGDEREPDRARRLGSPVRAPARRELSLQLALPYALAAYGVGRRAQIVRLRWTNVDLAIGAIEWGVSGSRASTTPPAVSCPRCRVCPRCLSANTSNRAGRRTGWCAHRSRTGVRPAC